MIIKRQSILTGIVREMDLPITADRLQEWESGQKLIQQAFPDLSPDQREFLMTGITAEEWDEATKEDDDE